MRIEREGEVGGSERRETAGNGGEEEEEDKSWQIDITQLLEMRQPKSNLRKAKKKVRRFYKKQNATISGFEQMHLFADRMERMNTRQRRKMQEKQKRAYRYERVGQVDDDGDGDGPGGDVEMQEFGSESDNTSGDDDGDDDDDTDDDEKDLLKHLEEEEDEKIAFWGKLAVQLSFWCNVLLLLLKLAAALVTGSLSIISSTLDSSLDLLSGLILYLTNVYRNRRSKKDIYSWPLGKSRFEPLGFIMFATVMCTASLMVVLEGVLELVTGVWSMYISPPSAAYQECMKLAQEEENKLMTEIFFYVGIGVMVFTIVVKSILFIICTLVHRGSPTVKAYAMDHRNDVLSNAILLVAIILAHYVSFLWWTDPFGAICLSLFIVQSWMRASWQQVVKIVGKNAPPEFLQKLTYLAYNHDPRIQHIDTVYAFYIGQNLFVEVDIVMDQNTILKVWLDLNITRFLLLKHVGKGERTNSINGLMMPPFFLVLAHITQGMLSNIMMRSSSQFNALFV